jgi:hypothetical protein
LTHALTDILRISDQLDVIFQPWTLCGNQILPEPQG